MGELYSLEREAQSNKKSLIKKSQGIISLREFKRIKEREKYNSTIEISSQNVYDCAEALLDAFIDSNKLPLAMDDTVSIQSDKGTLRLISHNERNPIAISLKYNHKRLRVVNKNPEYSKGIIEIICLLTKFLSEKRIPYQQVN